MRQRVWSAVATIRARCRGWHRPPLVVHRCAGRSALVLDFPVAEHLDACPAEGVGIVSTFWGDPATVHDRIHAMGAVHLHSVGSVDEARRAR